MTPDELDAIRRGSNLYALGVVPSGVTAKDFLATDPDAPPRAAPPRFSHPALRKLPIKNQQGGTCVGNSTAYCMEAFEYVQRGGVVVDVAGEELNGRVVHVEGAGASPHDVLEDVRQHGAAVTVDGHDRGLLYPAGYAAVDWRDPENIKAAMSTPNTMVTMSVWLTRAFDDADDGHSYAHDDPTQVPWGYHELTPFAYDENGLLGPNSWGADWGADHGHFRLGWDYVTARLGECWAITDNPDVAAGYIRTYDYGSAPETAIARPDLPTRKRPAVYLVKDNGRIWIKDPYEAKRMGVRLPPTRVPDTDTRWALPVIGPDAPPNLR